MPPLLLLGELTSRNGLCLRSGLRFSELPLRCDNSSSAAAMLASLVNGSRVSSSRTGGGDRASASSMSDMPRSMLLPSATELLGGFREFSATGSDGLTSSDGSTFGSWVGASGAAGASDLFHAANVFANRRSPSAATRAVGVPVGEEEEEARGLAVRQPGRPPLGLAVVGVTAAGPGGAVFGVGGAGWCIVTGEPAATLALLKGDSWMRLCSPTSAPSLVNSHLALLYRWPSAQ
mmetsp:Transcript_14995/g.37659  ORF Transcript_14995/g.37659 Transcript_14995/m.37659 type:complete len:234 (+) Transcript_14995:445-1146(+)